MSLKERLCDWTARRGTCPICQQPVRKVRLPELTGRRVWSADGPHSEIKERIEYWCACHPDYGTLEP